MNIGNWKFSVVLSLFAGCTGYLLNAGWTAVFPASSAQTMSRLEDFESSASFSEVENSKSLLEAECRRFIVEFRTKWVPMLHSIPAHRPQVSTQPRGITNQINPVLKIKQKIEEFAGTGQEFLLVGELLTVLRSEKQVNEWLDVYLRNLYQHPTQPLIGQWADRAIETSRAAGRESEVLKAFQHVAGIPIDFSAKEVITAILAEAPPPKEHFVARWR